MITSLIRPPVLRPGDRVAVVAPASPFPAQAFETGLAALEGLGWEPVLAPHVAASTGHLAGSDAQRAGDLAWAFDDPSLRAVFCARGGMGSTRLLETLDAGSLRAHPKPIVGFSDITGLLAWATQTVGVPGIHGPVVTQLGASDAPTFGALGGLLGGALGPGSVLLGGLRGLRGGRAEGVLRGGNLSVLAALAGTRHQVPLADAVLVLEDTGEPPYRVDRLLTQLRGLADWDRLAGIVLGGFDGTDESELNELLDELAALAPCPVVRGAPVGHGRQNLPLPLGVRVRLDAAEGAVTLLEAPFSEIPPAPTVWLPRPAPDPVALLEDAVGAGVAPGAALRVDRGTDVVLEAHVGVRSLGPTPLPVEAGTLFDVASLTKPLATVALAMQAVQRGTLDLDAPVPDDLPWLAEGAAWSGVTARHLLQHSAGIPDWAPLFAVARRRHRDAAPGTRVIRECYRERLAALPRSSPPGHTVVYSDLGFLVLGELLEARLGDRLDTLFARDIAPAVAPGTAGYRPFTSWDGTPAEDASVAATESCPWRRRVLAGAVHDDNAYALGGVAPHAGLFATADAVAALARELLAASRGEPNRLGLDADVVGGFWDAPPVGDATWALGWDRPAAVGSSSGTGFPPDAVGHLGFTGCSVWMDRREALVVTLLTNRIHPSRYDVRIRQLRPRLHDAVRAHLGL